MNNLNLQYIDIFLYGEVVIIKDDNFPNQVLGSRRCQAAETEAK
jgi:hypothetical protein